MAGQRDQPSPEPSPLGDDHVIDNIQLGKQIGRGANGRILEAKWEGVIVAVKEMHSIFMNELSEEEFQYFKRGFLRECEQSSQLRHPNVVRFLGIYHPPGARVPSLVMERLYCSLTDLLEQHPVIPVRTKLSIVYDVALGVRYLHTRTPFIIHRDLSSNNVLLSIALEGKVGDLGTARFVDPRRQSRMTKAPGTIDFMPPEALAAGDNVRYGRELDVFSFGCVMLHTLSHEWPTPSEPVVTDRVTFKVEGRTEVERRRSYLDKIDGSRSGMLILMIESCLSNLPESRTSIVRVCEQLEGLVVREHVLTTELAVSRLQEEVERKDAEIQMKAIEIQRKDNEIDAKIVQIRSLAAEMKALRSDMSKFQNMSTHFLVNKNSTDYWNNLNLNWQQCTDLHRKYYAISVAELDGKVYATVQDSKVSHNAPIMYDSHKDQWSILPELPCARFSLVTVPEKKQLLAIGGVMNRVVEYSNKVFLWDEKNRKWLTPYPNMPTARKVASCASHGSAVIVAGGVTCDNPFTMTRAVEILHIKEQTWFSKSYWSVVEQLPHVVSEAVPLVFNNNIYIAGGLNMNSYYTCNIIIASIPELLQSSNSNTSNSQVWKRLPDMPYPSPSINHYQGRLITFTGAKLTDIDKQLFDLVPVMHLYNPTSQSWDCVGMVPLGHFLGRSVHIKDNQILFIGGLCGTYHASRDDDLVTTCSILTLTPQ